MFSFLFQTRDEYWVKTTELAFESPVYYNSITIVSMVYIRGTRVLVNTVIEKKNIAHIGGLTNEC